MGKQIILLTYKVHILKYDVIKFQDINANNIK